MHNQRTIFPALTMLAAALAVTPSHAATASACDGYPVDGTAEISVDVRAQPMALPSSGRYVLDYSASLGPANSQNTVCFSGDSTLIYTLSDSGRYAFRDIVFELPFGYEPAASPFKLWTVQAQSIVVHVVDTPESAGQVFKYTIKVEDRRTGAIIFIDPELSDRN
ncbi:MAG: hypothetical protein CVV12_00540 [Gammaproteobacteria bacterium HGW-Gammaproteobacteria-2]|jgi:hypothetical protein|nr:MAG: hypothetical protein CVV12_00540 [Gammaproteobacteria bacterium HGW-Gammaproteobacteria-2]